MFFLSLIRRAVRPTLNLFLLLFVINVCQTKEAFIAKYKINTLSFNLNTLDPKKLQHFLKSYLFWNYTSLDLI